MKYTCYGLISTFALLIGLSMIDLNVKFTLLLLLIIVLQSQFCNSCNTSYNMISFVSIVPLVILMFYNCNDSYNFILAFAITLAIGRFACYFAGCCTGKETNNNFMSIKYEGDYVINKKLKKNIVYVKPTIFLEIFFQIIIVSILITSKKPLILFGLLNALLLYLTDEWRFNGRTNSKIFKYITISLLLVFSFFSYVLCKDINYKLKIVYNFTFTKLFLAILAGLIVSNDINVINISNITL
mgnify:FL=1